MFLETGSIDDKFIHEERHFSPSGVDNVQYNKKEWVVLLALILQAPMANASVEAFGHDNRSENVPELSFTEMNVFV